MPVRYYCLDGKILKLETSFLLMFQMNHCSSVFSFENKTYDCTTIGDIATSSCDSLIYIHKFGDFEQKCKLMYIVAQIIHNS